MPTLPHREKENGCASLTHLSRDMYQIAHLRVIIFRSAYERGTPSKESIEVLIRFSNLNSASVLVLAHFCLTEFSRATARFLMRVGFLEVANEDVGTRGGEAEGWGPCACPRPWRPHYTHLFSEH